MFIKTMTITKGKEVIRTLTFQKGLNLIIDQTPEDDIKTTGATLDECAKALFKAGADDVYCVTGLISKGKNKKR